MIQAKQLTRVPLALRQRPGLAVARLVPRASTLNTSNTSQPLQTRGYAQYPFGPGGPNFPPFGPGGGGGGGGGFPPFGGRRFPGGPGGPGGGQPPQQPPGEAAQEKGATLKQFSVDLTALAAKGKLDPVIGRDEEIRRTIQILSRRTKSNPMLIGLPGVGKTAIIEGLAQRIVDKEVPESMQDKRLLSIDLSGLIAGSGVRGEFESRFKALLKDIDDEAGNVIVFIDEVHTLLSESGV